MTTQSPAGPGGYLVKDFADGWYWTPNAALDHASGALVWSVADGRYETDPPVILIVAEEPQAAEDVHRTMDGETVGGFRVVAWRYIGPQDPDDARYGYRYCEHWSSVGNVPKKVERLFTEEQLRAAMLSAAPAPEGGAVMKACADFQEAIDYFEADVADAMAEESERADLWDREVTVNIDALKVVMRAALATREEAPANTGECPCNLKADDCHPDCPHGREKPPAHAFVQSHSVTSEGGCKICGRDKEAHEAPAEAGEDAEAVVRRWANWIIDESSDMDHDDHDAGRRKVRAERDLILSALRAQPPAREDALRVAVEALEAINHIRSEMVGVPVDSEAANAWAMALDAAADHARQALAALQAEQGAR